MWVDTKNIVLEFYSKKYYNRMRRELSLTNKLILTKHLFCQLNTMEQNSQILNSTVQYRTDHQFKLLPLPFIVNYYFGPLGNGQDNFTNRQTHTQKRIHMI